MSKLWFKRKRFGWGWTPSTVEGWTVTAIFAGLFITLMAYNERASAVLLALVFIFICYKKGESPKWSWG